jgi:hypothetical protein
MVIKHVKKPTTVPQHRDSASQTVMEKTKRTAEWSNSTQKAFLGPKHGKFNAIGDKVLEFVLEKNKNGLPIPREAIKNEGTENCYILRFHSKISKSLMAGQ